MVVWATVPYAASGHVYANIRYLLPALGLALAGGVAAAEGWGVGERGALASSPWGSPPRTSSSSTPPFPDSLRAGIAVADVLAAALALLARPARLARAVPRRSRGGGLGIAALAAVPSFARFRDADRARAFLEEYTAHVTSTPRYARAWNWLDRNGGTGAVDVVSAPDTFFVYPAMGRASSGGRATSTSTRPTSTRRRTTRSASRGTTSSPDRLARQRAPRRGALAPAQPQAPLRPPPEADWARARPDLFALRYQDSNDVIFEVLQGRLRSTRSPAPAPGHPSP